MLLSRALSRNAKKIGLMKSREIGLFVTAPFSGFTNPFGGMKVDRNELDLGGADFPITIKASYNDFITGATGKIVVINNDMTSFSVENVKSKCDNYLYSVIFEVENEDQLPDHAIVSLTEQLGEIVTGINQDIFSSNKKKDNLFEQFLEKINCFEINVDRISLKSKNIETSKVEIEMLGDC